MYCCQTEKQQSVAEQTPAPVPVTPRTVRTAQHPPLPPSKALQMLREGNQRYVEGSVLPRTTGMELRSALATQGQNPSAVVIACADSRCPIEIVFDAQPGDLFVLRNAGNTCTHAEGSIVGSLEYSTGHLKTSLVLVLGHTKCGAIAGATKTMLANRDSKDETKGKDEGKKPTALEVLLQSLTPVAEKAASELPKGAEVDEIAAHAVKVNVINTMDKLLQYSEALRERVRRREVQVHGAIYCLDSGRVDFIGQSPNLGRLADSEDAPPPVTPRYSVDMKEGLQDRAPEVTANEEGSGEAPVPEPAKQPPKANAAVSSQRRRWYHHLLA